MNLIWKTRTPQGSEKSPTYTTGKSLTDIREVAEIVEPEELTWEDWERAVEWQQSTIAGLLLEDSTMPLPLELLPVYKY